MNRAIRCSLTFVALALVSCSASTTPPTSPARASAPVAKKQLVAAIHADPASLHLQLTQPSNPVIPGLAELHQLLNGAMTYSDDQDVLQPYLADAVPSVENGDWQVLPDGSMETTWHIKPGVQWQDGAPFSADDLLFSYQLFQDRDLGIFHPASLNLVDSVDSPNAQTVVVKWKSLFIEADTMFSPILVMPLPQHLLQETYTQDKADFFTMSYWHEDFVGTGPYRMTAWVPSSHATLVANESYVFGRPKIDQIEVDFIPDFNTVVANLEAGTVTMMIGARFPADQAITIRDSAPNLNVVLADRLGMVVPLYPQYVDADPAIVTNVEFRKALLEGINRQEMNDTINNGIGPIADSWLQPDTLEYQAIQGQVIRYDYDPARAAQTIADLGYTKGASGMWLDSAGQPLHIEVRTTAQERIMPPSAESVVDYWKRLGIDAEVNILPVQRLTDRKYVATFPAFHLTTGGQGLEVKNMLRWRNSQSPSAQNQWAGQNRGRYSNPDFDRLIEQYGTTISKPDRLVVLGQIIHFQTDQLTLLPLVYEADGAVLGPKQLKHVTGIKVWDAYQWDYN